MKTASYIIIGVIVLLMLISLNHPKEEEIVRLPTILEVQRTLIAEGFDIEADGMLGPATQRAWKAHDTGLRQWWDDAEQKGGE